MPEATSAGLLLCRDLFFTSKVTGTAEALGCRIETLGSKARVLARLEQSRPAVLLLDLAAGDLVAPQAIEQYRALAPGVPCIAFGSHVDTATLQKAAEAGCEQVMPRSRFVNELPALIRQHLGAPPSPGGHGHENDSHGGV